MGAQAPHAAAAGLSWLGLHWTWMHYLGWLLHPSLSHLPAQSFLLVPMQLLLAHPHYGALCLLQPLSLWPQRTHRHLSRLLHPQYQLLVHLQMQPHAISCQQ